MSASPLRWAGSLYSEKKFCGFFHAGVDKFFMNFECRFVKIRTGLPEIGIFKVFVATWLGGPPSWLLSVGFKRPRFDEHFATCVNIQSISQLVGPTSRADCTPKRNEKSHINICPICLRLWDIMNFLLITFTKDARNNHLAFEDKPARVLSLIWLLSLSFLVFLEFVGSLALFYFVVFQHFQSVLRIQ